MVFCQVFIGKYFDNQLIVFSVGLHEPLGVF